jgi:hypothetical protein
MSGDNASVVHAYANRDPRADRDICDFRYSTPLMTMEVRRRAGDAPHEGEFR